MKSNHDQMRELPATHDDYASRARLIQYLLTSPPMQDAPATTTLLYSADIPAAEMTELSGVPRATSTGSTISGLDYVFSQEIILALADARSMLSPILAKMCPLITKKGRKPVPATDWVRNSAKNRAHMSTIGRLALQTELIQIAQDDNCTELHRAYLMSCLGDERILGELVKLIIFGISSATCGEAVESFARIITLIVGMTLGNPHLKNDHNRAAATATHTKQKSKKGGKSKQNKGNENTRRNESKVHSLEHSTDCETTGEQVQNPLTAAGDGNETLLAYLVARAAYHTWTSEYLRHEMLSPQLSTLLPIRHSAHAENAAMTLSPRLRHLESRPEGIARETSMRKAVERKERERFYNAIYEVPPTYGSPPEYNEDAAGTTYNPSLRLRHQLEEFLSDNLSPTVPNAFRDLMEEFSTDPEEPKCSDYSLDKLLCMECFRRLPLELQEARALGTLYQINTPFEVPISILRTPDNGPNSGETVGEDGEDYVELLSDSAAVRIYGPCGSEAATSRMWSEVYECFLDTYLLKLVIRNGLLLLLLPTQVDGHYADPVTQYTDQLRAHQFCSSCYRKLIIPSCTRVKYTLQQAESELFKQAEGVVADWFSRPEMDLFTDKL